MKHSTIIITAVGVMLIVGLYLGILAAHSESFSPPFNIPFVEREEKQTRVWSIGIYTGKDPFNLTSSMNIRNPVLTANDVTDAPADGVADPFMVYENDTWYMFFHITSTDPPRRDIAFATSSNGFNWNYESIVLDEPFQLSYPCVFKWKNEYFMVPESHQTNSIRLYKANDFPMNWSFVKTLVEGEDYTDPTVFHSDDYCWMFAGTNYYNMTDTLRLYYSSTPLGPWTEHPKSPIIKGNANIARPGGRVITFDGRIIRFTQDGAPTYGNQVRAFEIDVLSTTDYKEHECCESPILETCGIYKKAFWKIDAAHHIDPHKITQNEWIACVDGLCLSAVKRYVVKFPIPFIRSDREDKNE